MTWPIPPEVPPIIANTLALAAFWITNDRRLARLEILVTRLCGQHPDTHPPIPQPRPQPDAPDEGAV